MKLQDQVTNLEISQKLKGLGVPQDSLFWWCMSYEDVGDGQDYVPTLSNSQLKESGQVNSGGGFCSAFTVAELGEMLPVKCKSYKGGTDFYWACELKHDNGYSSKSGSATEADARGKMLIYLLENKLVTL